MNDLVKMVVSEGPLRELAEDFHGLHEAYCEFVCRSRIESGEDPHHTPRCKSLCERYGLTPGQWRAKPVPVCSRGAGA